jgi:uncharacterized protein YdaU (DUF1376 family)
VNFYKHYIGDFQRDTGHLSLTQRGAYRALMDHYYATEKPLPNDHAALCRIAGALDKNERDAVRVAMGFFEPCESGLMHTRIEVELHKAGELSNTNREIALAREATRRAARLEHEQSTKRAPSVPRTDHEQSTNQTPDTIEDLSDVPNGTSSSAGPTGKRRPTIPCPYADIVAAYHEALPDLPRAKLMPPKRQAALRKAWGWVLNSIKSDGQPRATNADEALAWLRGYFERASHNDFLMGRGARSAEHANWRCDIDFLLTDKGMAHVIEKTRDAA